MSVAHLLAASALSDRDLARLVAGRLRARSVGLAQSVAPVLEACDTALAEPSLSGHERLSTLAHFHALLINCLADRYDSLDSAVRESSIAFAEIDHAGKISYANQVLSALVANAIGQPFAELFDKRAPEVTAGLKGGTNISFRLELRTERALRQFRVELGPLLDEAGELGAYAILLDVGAEEQRLDAASDGILRIDCSGAIVFANVAARALLDRSKAQLLGSAASPLFLDPANAAANPVSSWMGLESGQEKNLVLTHSKTPVQVTSLPFFDEPGRISGILLSFRSRVNELAKQQLQHLLRTQGTPAELICGLMRVVRSIIPCDMMTFGVYTDDMGHFRTIMVDPPLRSAWSTRWFDLPPNIEAWLNDGDTFADDIEKFMAGNMPNAAADPVVLAMHEQKLKSFLALPVRGTGGRFRNALTLLSTKPAAYVKQDLDRLHALGLEEVLQAVEEAVDRQRDDGVRTLKRDLAKAANAKALARTLAEGVTRCFDWEYAGVFRVDRSKQRFVLFAQYDATGGSLVVPDNYSQLLSDGMLHHAYTQEKTLIDPDTEHSQWDFIATSDRQRSAMIVPIMVNGRVELLLDIESAQTNAFQGEDRELAESLATDCQQIFESRWQGTIRSALLNTMEQAALVVDSTGRIREMNSTAEEMFGTVVETQLSDLGADKSSRRLLQKSMPYDQQHLTLRRAGVDAEIPTLGTQRPLNDDYGHRMWLFTNLKEQRWARDWRYLDETVSEVARQTRAPLLIADNLLRRAKDMLASASIGGKTADLLDRVASQLGKADLTFERLCDTLTAHQPPDDPQSVFDAIDTLRQSIQALPPDEAEAVTFKTSLGEFPIKGWADRLGFAFRTLLTHLLHRRAEGRLVHAEARAAAGGQLHIRLWSHAVATEASEPNAADPIASATDRARRMVQLAPDAIRAAVQRHNGRFSEERSGMAFLIALPAHSAKVEP